MNNKVLIVDDNEEIQEANKEYLTGKGYVVDTAFNSAEALALLKAKPYDCIVMDVLMPDLNGFDLCAFARDIVSTPVIFLSCMDDEPSRLQGLSTGDDYMVKPYSVKELAMRINNQIMRGNVISREAVPGAALPGVMKSKAAHAIAIGDRKLILSQKEFELLTILMANSNETVSKSELLRRLLIEDSSLAVYVKRVRAKLEAHENLGGIETVFKQGYKYIPGNRARGKEAGE